MNVEAKELTPDEQAFIEKHLHEDPAALALRHASDPRKRLLIKQIKARQQIRKKLPEWYGNPQIFFPDTLPLEQASSEETARLKASLISGTHLLDITGGLGIDAYYLSRSFKTTTYVEKNSELARCAAHNFKILSAEIIVKAADGVEALYHSDADVVYVDPYRRDGHQNKMVSLEDCEPDVTRLVDVLTEKDRKALIKASPMLDITQAIKELKYVAEVWVISLRNDCKEVVYLLQPEVQPPVKVRCFNITPHVTEAFALPFGGKPQNLHLSDPEQYIYEPNSAILKSGGQDLLTEQYNTFKLHPLSNLFTSKDLYPDFPGKKFKLKNTLKPWDKSLKGQKLNVVSRNFPAKANLIEKKLRLSPSQNKYLLATKLQNNDLKFLICELIDPT